MTRATRAALKINGLLMPGDLPVEAFEAVHTKLGPFSTTHNALYVHFTGAWNALSYRYFSLADYGEAFTNSIIAHGAAPDAERRSQQERDLFGFFSNGFSVFESFFYGMYAVGALLNSSRFPLVTPADQQRVNPTRTIDAFSKAFAAESHPKRIFGIRERQRVQGVPRNLKRAHPPKRTGSNALRDI